MGTFLALGGWLRFPEETALQRWLELTVDSPGFSDWPELLGGPADVPRIDQGTIGSLLEQVTTPGFLDGRVLLARTATTLRLAATLWEGDGCASWAPALVAALRRGAEVGAEGRGAFMFADGGNVATLEVEPGHSEAREPEDDREVARAEKLPELQAGFGASAAGASLDDLPPLPKPSPGKKRAKKKPAPGRPPARKPKVPPRTTVLRLPTRAALYCLAREPSGELWAAGETGVVVHGRADLVHGRVEVSPWEARPTGDPRSVVRLVVDGPRLWAAGHSGLLICSEDRGEHWEMRSPDPEGSFAINGLWALGDLVVAAAEDGRVWRSEDAGAGWSQVFKTPEWGLTALVRGSGERLVGVGMGGIVIESTDLGRTFRTTHPGPDAALSRVWGGNGSVWAVGMDRILRAPEEQSGKLAYVGPKRDRDATFCAVDGAGGAVWVAGWDGALRSLDGGDTWEIAHRKEGLLGYAILALSEREAIMAGGYGQVVHIRF